MSTFETLINLAYSATGLIPGMKEIHGRVGIAKEVAPVAQEVYEYFQTPEGQRALYQINRLFKVVSHALPEENRVFAPPPVMEHHYKGWRWVWVGGFEGYRWQQVGD